MTTTLRMPRRWASNTNYSTGPDSGTPTKVDPSSDANGFIKGVIAAPQHVNFLLAQANAAAARALTVAALRPRVLTGLTLDVAGGAAAVSQGRGKAIVLGTAHSGGVPLINDSSYTLGGVIASITGSVNGGARNPTSGRIVLVGVGGNRSCFSDDGGATWSAGGDVGATCNDLLFNPTYTRFVALRSGFISYSTNAASWSSTAQTYANTRGIALLPNGNMGVAVAATPVSFLVSTNGATSWSAGAGTIPNASNTGGEAGQVTGCGLDFVYHAVVVTSGADSGKLQISVTSDLSTWTAVATFAPPAGGSFAAGTAAIRQCPDSGALFVSASVGSDPGQFFVSLDQGSTWSEPMYVHTGLGASRATFNAAGGKLILSESATGGVYQSDGIGWT